MGYAIGYYSFNEIRIDLLVRIEFTCITHMPLRNANYKSIITSLANSGRIIAR